MCRLRASVFSVGITDPKAIFKIAKIMMRFVPVLSAFLDIGAIAALYIAAAIFAPSRSYGLLYSGFDDAS
jgi:hypothetical protein